MNDEKVKFKKHHHDHDHHDCGDHKHSHDHSNHPATFQSAFIIGITLNLLFTLIEFFYGIISNSIALIADAGHNLSDVLGLVIAFIATLLLKQKANKKFTYGLRGGTVLSALINASLLFIAVGAILWESIHRLQNGHEIQTNTMMIVAGIGIIINFTTAMFFKSHSHDDLNAKGAFLHLMADAAISLGVVIAGLIIKYTSLTIIDPIVSIIISIIIVVGTWSLFKEALFLSINAVPEKIDIDGITNFLLNQNGVSALHDLHVWAMSTTENALTVHLIMPLGNSNDLFLNTIEKNLKEKFHINHSTIQIETKIDHEHEHNACYKPT